MRLLLSFLRGLANAAHMFAAPDSHALSALPATPGRQVHVVALQGMSLGTDGFLRVERRWSDAAQDVLSVRDGLQVLGVDAKAITAKVVEHGRRLLTPFSLPGPAMRHLSQSCAHYYAVALGRWLTSPNPAGRIEGAGTHVVFLAKGQSTVMAHEEATGLALHIAPLGIVPRCNRCGFAAATFA